MTDRVMRVRVNDDVYAVDLAEVPLRLAQECTATLGRSPEQVINDLFRMPGKIAVVNFVWLARRILGVAPVVRTGRVSVPLIEEIYGSVSTFDDEIDVLLPDDEGGDGPPVG